MGDEEGKIIFNKEMTEKLHNIDQIGEKRKYWHIIM